MHLILVTEECRSAREELATQCAGFSVSYDSPVSCSPQGAELMVWWGRQADKLSAKRLKLALSAVRENVRCEALGLTWAMRTPAEADLGWTESKS